MPNIKNLVGKKFGKLTVIERARTNKLGKIMWKCKCECGSYTIVPANNLISGNTKSCGCGEQENRKKIGKTIGTRNLKKFIEKDCVENTALSNLTMKKPKHNTSGVKGVSWDKSRNKWEAYIEFKGKKHHLGRFDEKMLAIEARKQAEEKYFKPIIEKYKSVTYE